MLSRRAGRRLLLPHYTPGQQGFNQLGKVALLRVSAFVFSCSSAEQIGIV